MAVRMLWKFVTGRAKTLFKNYNVVERAEKVMEVEKRVAPRHPGTEKKFETLIKGYKDLQQELERKPTDLLDRLKAVKVASTDELQDDKKDTRALPQSRDPFGIPTYGFEEPKVIPEGRCSFKEALKFITNHQNDPTSHSSESIAKRYKLKTDDVQNVIEHFRAFEVYISANDKTAVAKSSLEALGAKKIVKAQHKPTFSGMSAKKVSAAEEKK